MKNKEEILDQHQPNREYPSYYHESNVLEAMEEYAEQFKPQWIPVNEMREHKITNNTILLFDTGEVRRYKEEHPFAIITHFHNPPQPPKED